MVNTSYVTGIREALEESSFMLNEKLKAVYEEWLKEHPFDAGAGWAGEPWFQKEMPLTEELVRSAGEESDTAVIIIARTAGEDQDNLNHPGSYLLAQAEEEMLEQVAKDALLSIQLRFNCRSATVDQIYELVKKAC